MAVWVKICGITRAEDARAAFEAGADAIGLNFVGGPRQVTPDAAEALLASVPAGGVVVALVPLGPRGVEPFLERWIERHGVRHVQVYGHVGPENIRRLVERGYRPLIVCRLRSGEDPPSIRAAVSAATCGMPGAELFALVLDTHTPDQQGGTGVPWDWAALAEARERGDLEGLPPLVLAGGLRPDNVALAVKTVRPWGVDVSSGVEDRPGWKDPGAVKEFIREAQSAG